MIQETEIKLRVNSHDDAHRRLLAHGFFVSRERVFERNLIFDTHDQSLRASGRLLRLREAGTGSVITYKGPAETGKHKSREETEVGVANFDEMQVILERLGYRVTFRYDKHRTEFCLTGSPGIATIDETPVGTFMELEGAPEWIDEIAEHLGFKESDYITESYATLYSRSRSSTSL
jgi:adenylate cyclase, class 2